MALIEAHAVTFWNSVPAALEMLLTWAEPHGKQCPALRTVIVGGDWVPPMLHERLRRIAPEVALYSIGGPTETTVWNIVNQVREELDWRSVPYGYPLPNCTYRILDDDLRDRPDWVTGEMYCGGAALARGYLNDAQRTAEAFITDPHSGERLYRTGDLGRYRPDGRIEFIGRRDGQLKVRGNRVETGEIQAVLENWPEIVRALAYLYQDRLAVTLVLAPGQAPLAEAELHRRAERDLSSAMVPSIWLQTEQLPLTGNGKVDMPRLLEQTAQAVAASPAQGADGRALNDVERTLAELWKDLLGRAPAGPDDNFFALGGDSLLAVRLNAAMRARFGKELPLARLFDHASLAGQAALLSNAGSGAERHIPALRQEEYPLSWSQESVWLVEQLAGGDSGYTILFGLRSDKTLQIELLRQALSALQQRHFPLACVYVATDAGPRQRRICAVEPPLVIEERIAAAALQDTFALAAQRRFDLEHAPAWRVHLFPLAEGGYGILLNFHHIGFDGWSIQVFLSELAAEYRALQGSHGDKPVAAEISYGDYAVWNRQRVAAAEADDLAFWRNALEGGQDLALPTDAPRTAQRGMAGAVQGHRIPAGILAGVEQLASERGTTLFVALLAAYQALLGHYADQDDFFVGIYDAGREHPQTQNLIGCFVNNQVSRTHLQPAMTFAELVERTAEHRRRALDHQALPFPRLVQALGGGGDISRHPLYQVGFVMQAAASQLSALGATALQMLDVRIQTAHMDFELYVWPDPDGLRLQMNYNRALFKAETVQHLLRSYERLLAAVLRNPDSRLDALPGADDQPVSRRAAPSAYRSPVEMLQEGFALNGANTALIDGERHISFTQLDRMAGGIVVQLRQAGVGPGDAVGVNMPRSPEQVAALLACLYTGAVYVPLDPAQPLERLRYIVADAKPLLCLHRDGEGQDMGAARSMAVGGDEALAVPHPSKPEDVFALLYTSGSTGQPKGVKATLGSAASRMAWMRADYPLAPQDRYCQRTTLSFVDALWEVLDPLAAGAAVVIAGDARDPLVLAELIGQRQITRIAVVPSLLRGWLQAGEAALSRLGSLQYLFCSGEALEAPLMRAFYAALPQVRVVNLYGSSEVNDVAGYEVPRPVPDSIPIGAALPGCELYLLDRWGRVRPQGLPGVLHVGGDHLFAGYMDGRHAPFATVGAEKALSMGDIAHCGADGWLYYHGRRDDLVKVRGNRVELGEVAAVLQNIEAVEEQFVFAAQGADGETELRAALVLTGAARDADAVRRALAQRLPGYMVPTRLLVLERLPKLPNGKVDRHALASMNPSSDEERADPQSEIERRIAAIWNELLSVDPGRNDHFFHCGGHSLAAARLAGRLRAAFGVEVGMADIFTHPRLWEQAVWIEAADTASVDIPRRTGDGAVELSLNQHRLWFLQQVNRASVSYNMTFTLRLAGALDMSRLAHAFNGLAQRHEALRSGFVETVGDDGISRARLQVVPSVWISPAYRRVLGDLETPIGEETAKQQNTPFDLAQPPLMRVSVLEGEGSRFTIVVCLHHIIADGWSMSVLFRDLGALYRGETLAPLTLQYSDYGVWQRRWLAEETRRDRLDTFWRDYLDGAPKQLDLPADSPRRIGEPGEAAVLHRTFAAATCDKLLARATEANQDFYDTLLAAFACCLKGWGGANDMVLGTAAAARHPHPDLENIVGFFANTVPVRIELADGLTVGEAVAAVAASRRQAMAHQDQPFDRIVQLSGQSRDAGHTPLVQAMCIYQNAPFDGPDLPGISATIDPSTASEAKFDLLLQASRTDAGLIVQLEYARALFSASTMERFLDAYGRLLEALVSSPSSTLDELALFRRPPAYQHGGQVVLPSDLPRNLPQMLARTAARHPEHGLTLIEEHGETRITYPQLLQRSLELASQLRQAGITEGSALILLAGRLEPYLYALWGSLLAGATPVTVAHASDYRDDERASKLLHTWQSLDHPPILIQPGDLERFAPLQARHPQLRLLDTTKLPVQPGFTAANPAPQATAFYQLSAGSTGHSKCIDERHESLLAYMALSTHARGYSAEDHSLNWLPFDHIVPLLTFHLRDVYLGRNQTHVSTPLILEAPLRWLQLLSQRRITHSWAPNFAYKLATETLQRQSAELDLRHVRELINAGEMVSGQTMTHFAQAAMPYGLRQDVQVASFGMAECCTCITYAQAGEEELSSTQLRFTQEGVQAGASHFVSLGRVMGGIEIRIVDDHGSLAEEYQVGRFQIRGPTITRGYHNLEKANRAAFVGDGWFDSGDNGVIAQGRLYLTGRAKETLIVNGVNYFCHDLEARVERTEGVTATYAAALSWRDGEQEQAAICYVPRPGADIAQTNAAIRTRLIAETGLYPKRIVAIASEHFLKTTSGKIQRTRMAQRLAAGELPALDEAPRNSEPLIQRLSWQACPSTSQAPDGHWLIVGTGASADLGFPGQVTVLSPDELAGCTPPVPLAGVLLDERLADEPQTLAETMRALIAFAGRHGGGLLCAPVAHGDTVRAGRLHGLLTTLQREQSAWRPTVLERDADGTLRWPEPLEMGWYRQVDGELTRLRETAVETTIETETESADEADYILITGGAGALAQRLSVALRQRG